MHEFIHAFKPHALHLLKRFDVKCKIEKLLKSCSTSFSVFKMKSAALVTK